MRDDGNGTIRHDDGSLEMFIDLDDGDVLHLTLIPDRTTKTRREEPAYEPLPSRYPCAYARRWEARMREEREEG